jgi:hypothetical protein
VCDLGINIDEKLNFSTHIDIIRRKAHTRANLILRCFLSKNCDSLVKAFKVYVRPLIEYCTIIWSPVLIKHINAIENIQRQFTKRLPGLTNLSYAERLSALNLESLEVRRLRFDLTFMYKLMFGLSVLDKNVYFQPRNSIISLRGHDYCISVQRCNRTAQRRNFITSRICNVWNNLPADSTNFSNIRVFKRSVTNGYLSRHCIVNFHERIA